MEVFANGNKGVVSELKTQGQERKRPLVAARFVLTSEVRRKPGVGARYWGFGGMAAG